MSIRKDIEELFRADWETDPILSQLRVIATERELDQLSEPTALIRLQGMRREPSSPLQNKRVGLLLTIISEHVDLDLAGDDIEDYMTAAMDYLGPRFMFDAPTVVGYKDRLAVDFPLYIIATPAEPAALMAPADLTTPDAIEE